MNIDTHFHIFNKDHLNNGSLRYSINYDAPIEDWVELSRTQNIHGGVLIQPSFLGFDNSILIDTIQRHPDSLRGVCVVDPKTSSEELNHLKAQGVRGIRLNLFGDHDPIGSLDKYKSLISLLNTTDMHLQIHHDDGLLNDILLNIPVGTNIVIDHFGRPSTNDEFAKNSLGIDKHQGNLWVKLSAQYRTPNIDHQSLYRYWLRKLGASRLLWGSDWPHTRFEGTQTYEQQVRKFHALVSDGEISQKILIDNPKALYWR